MTPLQVDTILADYKNITARRTHIAEELDGLKHMLEEHTHVDQISTEAIKVQNYEKMSMPGNGRLNDPTASLGTFFADGGTPDYVWELQSEVKKLERQLAALERNVRFIDCWQLALNDRERFVISKRILDGYTWPATVDAFAATFGYGFSLATLKRHKERGMSKIYQAAGVMDPATL